MIPYSIYATGDSAVTFDLGQEISEQLNRKILSMKNWLQSHAPEGIKDIVTAYSSLCICYDFMQLRKYSAGNSYQFISKLLKAAYEECEENEEEKVIVKIPVCYDPEFGIDQQDICAFKNISREELIRLHMSVDYRVYMLGFLPGFPYLGKVDPMIAMERRPKPRPLVARGSVGIAGFQTGIYSLASPGGWQIIGRTPFWMFEPDTAEIVPVQPGQYVRFFSISKDEFEELNQ